MADIKVRQDEKVVELLEILKNGNAGTILQMINNSIDACWVDGCNCPYGSPNGKFNMAPTRWCSDCQKLSESTDMLKTFLFNIPAIQNEFEAMVDREAEKKLEEEKSALREILKPISDMLCNLAEGKGEIINDLVNAVIAALKLDKVKVLEEKLLK